MPIGITTNHDNEFYRYSVSISKNAIDKNKVRKLQTMTTRMGIRDSYLKRILFILLCHLETSPHLKNEIKNEE